MAGLLTAFLTGAATQANAQITEGKKLQADRDKRREEQADALQLYMDQNTFKSSLDETAAIATEARGLKDYGAKKEIDAKTDTATFATNAGVTYGYSSKLQSEKAAQETAQAATKAGYDAALVTEAFKRLGIGQISGGVASPKAIDTGGKGPTIEAASTLTGEAKAPAATLSDYYKMQEVADMIPGAAGKVVSKYAANRAKTLEKQAEAYNKGVTAAGGGDPFKSLDKLAEDSLGLEEKLFNPKHYSGPEQTAKTPSSLGNVKQLMVVLMDKTRGINPISGEATGYSMLNETDIRNNGLKLEANLAVLEAAKATPKEKQAAVEAIDTVLKDAKVSREEYLADPRLSAVFTETRKASFNNSLPQKALEAPAAPQASTPSQQDLEFTAKKHGISVAEVKQRLGLK
jgi:hypothetical protein